ncbi:MAG: hypothetical protein NVS2B4_20930 [Ramlibacter sp.]
MSDDPTLGFGKFVPGFDFLQNLAKGASQAMPQLPGLSNWIAPTLNVEELDKRIGELKAVHFWLDQNSKALTATIQALEVQKMTLATLKGMNVSMGEVATALMAKVDAAGAASAAPSPRGPAPAAAADKPATGAPTAPAATVVDPVQWWGALTQQFQQIAAGAMQDAARHNSLDSARTAATGVARQAMKTPTEVLEPATPAPAARPTRKASTKSPAPKATRGNRTAAKSAAPKTSAR